MSPTPPFIDGETGALDTGQVAREALRIAGLVVLFGSLAMLAFLVGLLAGGNAAVGLLFSFVAQLVIAVGAGVVLIYAVARGVQLADS
ncbi:MAG: hypothetical protein ABEJ92_06660 [Halobacteriales archaeon]